MYMTENVSDHKYDLRVKGQIHIKTGFFLHFDGGHSNMTQCLP